MLLHLRVSGGATPGRARSNALAGALAYALAAVTDCHREASPAGLREVRT